MVNKPMMNLDSSMVSGRDCIPAVASKNVEPELSYILAELFHICLKGFCFFDYSKVFLVVPVFDNVGKGLQLKTATMLVFFLWLVKTLKKF